MENMENYCIVGQIRVSDIGERAKPPQRVSLPMVGSKLGILRYTEMDGFGSLTARR